jgi:hypothetical protein
MDVKFDIFKKLPDGQPIWVKAVEGLEEAKLQLGQIASQFPGDYFIFDMRSGRKIAFHPAAALGLESELGTDLAG